MTNLKLYDLIDYTLYFFYILGSRSVFNSERLYWFIEKSQESNSNGIEGTDFIMTCGVVAGC